MNTTENNLHKGNKMNRLITQTHSMQDSQAFNSLGFSLYIQDTLPTPYSHKHKDTIYSWKVHRGDFFPTVPQALANRELFLCAAGLHWLFCLADFSSAAIVCMLP